MSATTQPHPNTGSPVVITVGPSLFVRVVMRPMTAMLNPLVTTLAGRRHMPMVAQLHHVGRRTGKPYVTPVGASLRNGAVLIPLTFGNKSDWVRNVRAAGHCSVRLNGTLYRVLAPQFIDAAQAPKQIRAAFGPVERLMFRMLGIKQFLRLPLAAR